jgi:hypothetical protein
LLALDVKRWDDNIRKSFRQFPITADAFKQLIQLFGFVPGPYQIMGGLQTLFQQLRKIKCPEIAYGELCELF